MQTLALQTKLKKTSNHLNFILFIFSNILIVSLFNIKLLYVDIITTKSYGLVLFNSINIII